MAKKTKKKMHQMPKLSAVDQLVYWLILVVLCLMYGALMFLPFWLRRRIAFADEMVIAAGEHVSFLWILVPWMTFFLMTFILWHIPYEERKPIFGLRNFKYGPPAWPKVYPVFMKNKPHVWVSSKAKENRRRIAAALLVVLLVSFIPFPWSLYGRDCLRADGGIEQYSMFNHQVRDFSSGQISEVEIGTYRYSSGRYRKTKHWGVQVTLTTDSGKTYTFRYNEFRDEEETQVPGWLTQMLRLKSRYDPQIITYEGAENLKKVISDRNLTAEGVQMLYQLFGLS